MRDSVSSIRSLWPRRACISNRDCHLIKNFPSIKGKSSIGFPSNLLKTYPQIPLLITSSQGWLGKSIQIWWVTGSPCISLHSSQCKCLMSYIVHIEPSVPYGLPWGHVRQSFAHPPHWLHEPSLMNSILCTLNFFTYFPHTWFLK